MTQHTSGHAYFGFDFTGHMRRICEDLVCRLPEFAHIDLGRVAICFSRARNRTRYGMHASLTPLRFPHGSTETVRRGRRFTVQRVKNEAGLEMLYLLSFYLPRFQDEPFLEKLTTVVHELWHISPEFNGDIRRHAGRCYAHSHSKAAYDDQMRALAQRYLASAPAPELLACLQFEYDALHRLHGRIYGEKVSRPRLIPLA